MDGDFTAHLRSHRRARKDRSTSERKGLGPRCLPSPTLGVAVLARSTAADSFTGPPAFVFTTRTRNDIGEAR